MLFPKMMLTDDQKLLVEMAVVVFVFDHHHIHIGN
jgi:hypothetical protein